jgi:glycolate oxidase iron-sulfur subunit
MADPAAFDLRDGPPAGLLADCVHCGFCLPACPTYQLWGDEMDSPRGRIALMKVGREPGSVLSDEMTLRFDNCLGCMSCLTACPSGVRYDRLIEATRAEVERRHRRRWSDRLWRATIFALFPHPGRLRALVPFLWAFRRIGGPARVGRSRLARRFPRLAALARMAPSVRLRDAWRRPRRHTVAAGVPRGTVGVLAGCVQQVFFGSVNDDTIAVLRAEGFDVVVPAAGCCGALGAHAGRLDGARERAKATIGAFDRCETVVANAAGCGSAMKEYDHWLADDPAWAARADAFVAKVRDISEFLAEIEPRAPRGPVPERVAYHDACHLAHAQGIRRAPRDLLRSIPQLEVLEIPGGETCCGSAGIFNLVKPEPAAELGRRKAQAIGATGAHTVAAGNPGCAVQIALHLDQAGAPLPVVHPISLLARSIEKGSR